MKTTLSLSYLTAIASGPQRPGQYAWYLVIGKTIKIPGHATHDVSLTLGERFGIRESGGSIFLIDPSDLSVEFPLTKALWKKLFEQSSSKSVMVNGEHMGAGDLDINGDYDPEGVRERKLSPSQKKGLSKAFRISRKAEIEEEAAYELHLAEVRNRPGEINVDVFRPDASTKEEEFRWYSSNVVLTLRTGEGESIKLPKGSKFGALLDHNNSSNIYLLLSEDMSRHFRIHTSDWSAQLHEKVTPFDGKVKGVWRNEGWLTKEGKAPWNPLFYHTYPYTELPVALWKLLVRYVDGVYYDDNFISPEIVKVFATLNKAKSNPHLAHVLAPETHEVWRGEEVAFKDIVKLLGKPSALNKKVHKSHLIKTGMYQFDIVHKAPTKVTSWSSLERVAANFALGHQGAERISYDDHAGFAERTKMMPFIFHAKVDKSFFGTARLMDDIKRSMDEIEGDIESEIFRYGNPLKVTVSVPAEFYDNWVEKHYK